VTERPPSRFRRGLAEMIDRAEKQGKVAVAAALRGLDRRVELQERRHDRG